MASMSSLSLIQIINLLHSTGCRSAEATPETVCQARLFVQKILERGLENVSSDAKILLSLFEEEVKTACQCKKMKRCEVRLNRRALRKNTGWSDPRLESSLEQLLDGNYLRAHQTGRSPFYELIYDSTASRRSNYLMEPTGPSRID